MTTDEQHDLATRVQGVVTDIRALLEIATATDGREVLACEMTYLDRAYTELSMVISLCYAERRLKAVG